MHFQKEVKFWDFCEQKYVFYNSDVMDNIEYRACAEISTLRLTTWIGLSSWGSASLWLTFEEKKTTIETRGGFTWPTINWYTRLFWKVARYIYYKQQLNCVQLLHQNLLPGPTQGCLFMIPTFSAKLTFRWNPLRADCSGTDSWTHPQGCLPVTDLQGGFS